MKNIIKIIAVIIVLFPAVSFAYTEADIRAGISGEIDVITFDDWSWAADYWPGDSPRYNDTNLDGDSGRFPQDNSSDTTMDTYATKWNDSKPSGHIGEWIYAYSNRCASGKCMVLGYAEPPDGNYPSKTTIAPDNLMYFFGTGDQPPDTYHEIYIFFRAYVPTTFFPTRYDSNNNIDLDTGGNPYVKHVDGHDFAYMASFKWFMPLASRTSSKYYYNFPTGANLTANDTLFKTYQNGLADYEPERWVHIKRGGDPSQLVIVTNFEDEAQGTGYQKPNQGTVNLVPFLDNVSGWEFRYKMETSKGADNGIFQAWAYDSNGNATQIYSQSGLSFLDDDQYGDGSPLSTSLYAGFTSLYMHSNVRVTAPNCDAYFKCGAGMECKVYYDDLIISEQRIGPDYYSVVLGGGGGGDTDPPTITSSSPSGTLGCE
jgi:hypothetical protein